METLQVRLDAVDRIKSYLPDPDQTKRSILKEAYEKDPFLKGVATGHDTYESLLEPTLEQYGSRRERLFPSKRERSRNIEGVIESINSVGVGWVPRLLTDPNKELRKRAGISLSLGAASGLALGVWAGFFIYGFATSQLNPENIAHFNAPSMVVGGLGGTALGAYIFTNDMMIKPRDLRQLTQAGNEAQEYLRQQHQELF